MRRTSRMSRPDGRRAELPRTLPPTGSHRVNIFSPTFDSEIGEWLGPLADFPALSAPLNFACLAADVAATFSAIAPDNIDDAIVDSLRRTGEAMRLDCAVLWRRSGGEAM